MAELGYMDIVVSFPDPVTNRGVAVNTLDVRVLDAYDNEIAALTLDDFEARPTLLAGVFYVHENFDVSDPNTTPNGFVKIVSTGTVGTQTLGPITVIDTFEPLVGDAARGVLIKWRPPEGDRVMYQDPGVENQFYEVRRRDRRVPNSPVQTPFEPTTFTAAFWSFDDDFEDEVSPPANLTATGPVERVTAQVGDGARFHGNGWLEAANPAKLSFGAQQDFSISCWALVNTQIDGLGYIVSKMGGTGEKGYAIFVQKTGVEYFAGLFLGGTSVQTNIVGTTPITSGYWHHFALTIDRDGNGVLYVDNAIYLTFDASVYVNEVFDAHNLRIGARDFTTPNYFWGMVDEVIVFNGLLTSLDVDKLYQDQLGRSPETVVARTNFTQYVDDGVPINEVRFYEWIIYRATSDLNAGSSEDYVYVRHACVLGRDAMYVDAPMCLVEGRVRLPDDISPLDAWAKFFVAHWDRGQVVHDRIVDRDEVVVHLDNYGRFAAYLIQDTVVVCHIPVAHIQWRFCVPRQAAAKLQDLNVEKLKFRNNL